MSMHNMNIIKVDNLYSQDGSRMAVPIDGEYDLYIRKAVLPNGDQDFSYSQVTVTTKEEAQAWLDRQVQG